MKTEIAMPLFTGFYYSIFCQYETWYESEFDHLTQDQGETDDEAREILDACDTRPAELAVSQDLAYTFLTIWNDNFPDCQIELKFVSLESPHSYNFATDEIIVQVEYDEKELEKLSHEIDFETYIKDNFTSYDGFFSYYSNDSEEWRKKAFIEWDEVEIASVFEAACKALELDSYTLYEKSNIFEEFINNVGYETAK